MVFFHAGFFLDSSGASGLEKNKPVEKIGNRKTGLIFFFVFHLRC